MRVASKKEGTALTRVDLIMFVPLIREGECMKAVLRRGSAFFESHFLTTKMSMYLLDWMLL